MKKNIHIEKGHLFQKKNKVSVWASTHPYEDIPESYFEETFYKNKTRAKNQFSNNFKMRYFSPELLETNGTMQGTVRIRDAINACSYADSFIENLMSKAIKKHMTQITWVVLLYEFEYSSKLTGVGKDDYLSLLGAFNYDAEADF